MKILVFRTVAHQMNVSSYNSQEIGLAKAFVQLGHNCDIIYFTWKEEKDEVLLELANCSARLLWRKGIPLLRTGIYPKLSKKCFLNQYDLIITNEYNQLMSLIVCRNHTKGKTFIYNGPYYNMFKLPFMDSIYDALLKNEFKKYCDWFLAKSVLSKKYLESRNFNNIDIIGVGLDTEKFEKNRNLSIQTQKIIQYMESQPSLLYVGSLNKRKNVSFLFEVFDVFCNINMKVNLLVVGKGDNNYISHCLSKIKDSTKKRIKFVENISNEEMPAIYRSSIGFILPSLKEIFGMVILEAMYFGCNVYSSANGGALTLIDNGVNGYVFDAFDAEEWANTINNTICYENRMRVGNNAHNTIVNRYTWSRIAQNILHIYKRVSEEDYE